MICGIYCIRNKINDKRYVGQSIDIVGTRWRDHKNDLRNDKHENKYLQHAWNKYGEENFAFEVVEMVKKEDLDKREIALIFEYKTFLDRSCGYNLTAGGLGGQRGVSRSVETREKISVAHKGKKLSSSHRQKLSVAHLGQQAWNKGFKQPERGLAMLGDNHHNAKLTWKEVRQMRKMYKNSKISQRQLGEKFGVARTTVQQIIENRSWKEDTL